MANPIMPAGREPKVRVSAKVRIAIEKMVDNGLNRAEAAKVSGLTDHALYCALRKPHVLAYRSDRLEVLRSSEASRTIARAADLADNAQSEHVRLQANEWLGGLDGVSPVQKSETIHHHRNVTPGLVIVMGGWQAPDSQDQVIDQKPLINRIGTPARHPEAES
ncbi:MAG: hypothetical protein ABIP64_05115 [Burkholderiales bacterium]